MKTLNFLVVPSSKWQVGLIKFLKRKKFKVYSLDDDDRAIGHKYSDARINLKTKNISKLRLECKKKKIIPISCCSDFGVKIINKILGKKVSYFNKLSQRKIQKKIGLNTPLFFNNKKFNLNNFIACNKKVISKPIIGSGSNGLNYHKKFRKIKDNKIFYEEYINGKEFNVEGILNNKELFFYAIMEKKKINNSKFVSYIFKKNNLESEITHNIKRVLSSFILNSKYPDGPFHAEIIVQKKTKKIFIVESHPREAGFNMFFFTCSKLTGLDLYSITTDLKLNKKVKKKLNTKKLQTNYCCRMIPIKRRGRIKKIYFKKFDDNNNIKTFTDIFVKKNDYLMNKHNDGSRLASIQSFSKNNKIDLEKYTLKIMKKYFFVEYY